MAIASGLTSGERIVVQGQLRLHQGARWQEAEPVAGANQVGANAKNEAAATGQTFKP
jgi:hypothetical protein